jgi:hypothetical protein
MLEILINPLPGVRPAGSKRMGDVDRPGVVTRAIRPSLVIPAASVAVMLAFVAVTAGRAQDAAVYPPLSAYLMPRGEEIALARSAAPSNVSGPASVKILTESGYQVASAGQNGFVCLVMRGWSAPTYTPAPFRDLVYDPSVRAPICFDPRASRAVLPYYELRSRLGMEGKSPDQIAEGVQAAYATGALPERAGVSFAYMWSADQHLGPGVGHWHPHMMVFAPYYENAMLVGNDFGSPLPQVSDDAGTPFTVALIPVDQQLAIKAAAVVDRDGGPTANVDGPPAEPLAPGRPHGPHGGDGS